MVGEFVFGMVKATVNSLFQYIQLWFQSLGRTEYVGFCSKNQLSRSNIIFLQDGSLPVISRGP